MNWDEDIDLLAGKKAAAKEGRRKSNSLFSAGTSSSGLDSLESPRESDSFEAVRTRKTGVWSDEGLKSGNKNKRSTNVIELERFQNEGSEAVPDIPEIPDIDDLQDDPLNLPDIKPIASVDKSTYKELDSQLGTFQSDQSSFGNLGNIDLSFLTSKLYPEKDVQIRSEIWTMESLFNDLSRSSS